MKAKAGLNKDGTFKKGHKPKRSAGRRPYYVEKEYVKATINTVKIEDWQEIVEIAMRDAKNGDAKAREWLSKYILGGRPCSASEALGDLPPPIIL